MTTLLSIAMAILAIVGQWFILEKMGEEGWKAIIPFYGPYLMFKHVWETKMFWASLALTLAGIAGCYVGCSLMLSGSIVSATVAFLVFAAALATSILAFVIDVKFMYRLCNCFGHGAGYVVGLLLLEPVFSLILGLGKDEYAGV